MVKRCAKYASHWIPEEPAANASQQKSASPSALVVGEDSVPVKTDLASKLTVAAAPQTGGLFLLGGVLLFFDRAM